MFKSWLILIFSFLFEIWIIIFLNSVLARIRILRNDFILSFLSISYIISAYKIKSFNYLFCFSNLRIDSSIFCSLFSTKSDFFSIVRYFTYLNAFFNISSAYEQTCKIGSRSIYISFHRIVCFASLYKSSHIYVFYLIVLMFEKIVIFQSVSILYNRFLDILY